MLEALQKHRGRDYEVKIKTGDFPENPLVLGTKELERLHTRVYDAKKGVSVLVLFLDYYQGLIYIALRTKSPTQEMYLQELAKCGVTYGTAQQFVMVTLLIKRYPRVIFAGLTHSQLRKHRSRCVIRALNQGFSYI